MILGAAGTLKKKRTCCAPSVCAWEAAEADYGSGSSSYEGSHELYCVGEMGTKSFYTQNVRTGLSSSIVTTECMTGSAIDPVKSLPWHLRPQKLMGHILGPTKWYVVPGRRMENQNVSSCLPEVFRMATSYNTT